MFVHPVEHHELEKSPPSETLSSAAQIANCLEKKSSKKIVHQAEDEPHAQAELRISSPVVVIDPAAASTLPIIPTALAPPPPPTESISEIKQVTLCEIPWSQVKLGTWLKDGGNGYIFSAKWEDKDVIMKISRLQSESAAKEFYEECLMLQAAQGSRYTVRFYGVSNSRDGLCMLMEYIASAKNLFDWAKMNAKDIYYNRNACKILSQVVDMLCELHNLGIAHLDLKDENLLVDSENRVKIIDFGNAIKLEDKQCLTLGDVRGTLSFMAPEINSKKEYGYQSDIYAFGTLTYLLIIKVDTDIAYEKIQKKMNTGQLPRIPTGCSTFWHQVINDCWKFEPKNRPTALELKNRIEKDKPTSLAKRF